MYCKSCGVEVPTGANFCPKCGHKMGEGASAPSTKTGSPWWFKTLMWLLLLGVIIGALYFFLLEDVNHPVEEQLKAIREDRITEAYYGFTSKAFQEATSLEKFKEFLKAYPLFSENSSVRFIERNVDNDSGTLFAIIDTPKGDLLVQYKLIKEDDKWKIQSFILEDSPEKKTPHSDPQDRSFVVPVESQIQFVQQRDFDKAYNQTVAQDFKNKFTFEEFRQYIQKHPIVMQFSDAHYDRLSQNNDHGKVTVLLSSPKGSAELQYQVVKEGGIWKIADLEIKDSSSSSEEKAFDETPLKDVVKKQLDLIKRRDLKKAYQDYASKKFKEETTQEQFDAFVKDHVPLIENRNIDFGHLTFDNNVAILSAMIVSKSGESNRVIYHLVDEGGQWKILFIQIKEDAHDAKKKSGSEPMKFTSFIIGTDVDLKGVVSAPTKSIPSNAKDIYLNVNIANGVPNTKVEVSLQHLASKSSLPAASSRISKAGDSTISLIFSSPPEGWPKGNYRVNARSSTGERSSYEFMVE